MSDKSAIEWTDRTWNPVTGCSKVSQGCKNCYAEKVSLRYGWSKKPWAERFAAENVVLHPDRLDPPLKWRSPSMVFVNSMSDLFHEQVPVGFIDRVFATMMIAGIERQTCKGGTRCQHDIGVSRGCYHAGDGREEPLQTFQILTKRPERMRVYLSDPNRLQAIHNVGNDPEWSTTWNGILWELTEWPLPNVWMGVSAENQRWADERIPLLLDTPAAVRFVSFEPMLGPIDLRCGCGALGNDCPKGASLIDGIDWVIVGGESAGPARRRLVDGPFDIIGHERYLPKPQAYEWVRSLRDQCVAAGVPFFFKQWGSPTPKGGGRMLDGRTWDQFPEIIHANA